MATGDLKEYMHSVRTKLGQVKHYQFMQGADMSRVSQAEKCLMMMMSSVVADSNE